jgi:hypothetical protein
MISLDVPRARHVAERLLTAMRTGGIFGTTEMPEDLVPAGVEIGSESHLRFITLTVAIDYMRDAGQLWNAARSTYAEAETRYLFDPVAVAQTGMLRLTADLQRYKLSKKHQVDAQTWQSICVALVRHFDGQVAQLIDRAGGEAPALLELIRSPRFRAGFPFLKGAKIGPLWVRMLHDNCGVKLHKLDQIPLPVDVHTAQATLQLGCVTPDGTSGRMEELREAVQAVWREALSAGTAFPLQIDEPLWLLSRQGCRVTSSWPCAFAERCPVVEFCVPEQRRLSTPSGGGQEAGEWAVTTRLPNQEATPS